MKKKDIEGVELINGQFNINVYLKQLKGDYINYNSEIVKDFNGLKEHLKLNIEDIDKIEILS